MEILNNSNISNISNISINIKDDTIRLGQLLKLANLVSSGGEAKIRIKAGEVMVNGAVDVRRGAQLRAGDRVEMDGRMVVIKAGQAG